ncbi:MAG: hypothetical protein R3F39_17445 [Myxococcota bacterium]
MTRRLWAGLCAALLASVAVGPASAAPPQGLTVEQRQRLGEADEAFRYQDYERTIKLLLPVLESGQIRDPEELLTTREHLGASYWFVGALDAARTEFGVLLKERPDHRLNKLFYPPGLVSFFEEHKKWLTDAGFIGDARPGSVLTGPRRTLVKTTIERRVPAIAYLMPFGVGQFANGAPAKGAVVAAVQGIGLAINVGSWLGVQALKRGKSNSIAAADEGRAELLRALWWVGTGMFSATWIYSVADGFAYRPPRKQVEQRWELLDPDDVPTPRDASGVKLQFDPGPTGLGLGLSGAF